MPSELLPAALNGHSQPPVLDVAEATGGNFTAWVELGERCRTIGVAATWWVADWWRYGKQEWPEECDAIADELFGRRAATLDNYAVLAHVFPATLRHLDVPISVYQALAPLARDDLGQAESLLSRVRDERLSREQVRELVAGEDPATAPARPSLRDAAHLVWAQAVPVTDARGRPGGHHVPQEAILALGAALGLA